MIDIKAIREAAEAAMQSEWVVNRCDTRFAIVSPSKRKAVKYDSICDVVWWSDRAYGPQKREAEANAKHIATANPATVIALCDEVESLRNGMFNIANQSTEPAIQEFARSYLEAK